MTWSNLEMAEVVSPGTNSKGSWWSAFDKLTETCGSDDPFVECLSKIHTFLSLGASDLAQPSLDELESMFRNTDKSISRKPISSLHIEAAHEIAEKVDCAQIKTFLVNFMIRRSLHLYCAELGYKESKQEIPAQEAQHDEHASSPESDSDTQSQEDEGYDQRHSVALSGSETSSQHNRSPVRKSCPATVSHRFNSSTSFQGQSPWKHGINTPSCVPKNNNHFSNGPSRQPPTCSTSCERCMELRSKLDTMEMQIQTLMAEREEQESHFKSKICTLQQKMSGYSSANGNGTEEYASVQAGPYVEEPNCSDSLNGHGHGHGHSNKVEDLNQKVSQLRSEFSRLQQVADEEVNGLRRAMKAKLRESKQREEKLVSLVHDLSNRLGLDGITLVSRRLKS